MVTVAIVDECEDVVDVIAEYLELIKVRVVAKGYTESEAVEIYKRHRPDAMILDIMAPSQRGIKALKRIRDLDPDAKVIILATNLNDVVSKELKDLGPSEILLKPFDMKLLTDFFQKIQTQKYTGTAKSALISITIEQALLRISGSALQDVGDRLYAKYGCYFSDCLDHPEYLRDVLEEMFGNGAAAITNAIRDSLVEFEYQQPISRFLTVICK